MPEKKSAPEEKNPESVKDVPVPQDQSSNENNVDAAQTAANESVKMVQDQMEQNDFQPFAWSEKEFIANEKGTMWYLYFALLIIVVSVIVFFVSGHSIFTTVMVLAIAVIFAVAAGHKPKVVDYEINSSGVNIGTRFRSFEEFKSYSISNDGQMPSITFEPLRRFGLPLTIYFDHGNGEKISSLLSNFLPNTENQKDSVEQLMHRIHF